MSARLRIAAALAVGLPSLAAPPPDVVVYQGYLSDADGVPVSADVELFFKLYDAPAAGTMLWSYSPGDVTVDWTSQDPTAGTATDYDVARGRLSALQLAGYPAGATCAADNLPDRPFVELAGVCTGAPGDGCWYHARAQSLCGTGTYGSGTFGASLDPFSPCP